MRIRTSDIDMAPAEAHASTASGRSSSAAPAWLHDVLPDAGLPAAQRRAVAVIRRNPQLATYAELSEIASRADVDASTVVRAAQSLGYRGWSDLQRELRARYLATISTEETLREHGEHLSPVHDALRHDMKNLSMALEANDPADAADAIGTLTDAASIVVIAHGSFAAPASVMAHLGATMGCPIVHENRGGPHLAGTLQRLGADDALVVINMWRPMRQIIAAAEAAHTGGTPVVAITDMQSGRLAELSEHVLLVPSEGLSFFQSVTAATSVVYGLLAGMEAARPERSRTALRRTQRLWKDLDVFAD